MKKRVSKRKLKAMIKNHEKQITNIFADMIANGEIHPAKPFNQEAESSLKEKGYFVKVEGTSTEEERNNRVCKVKIIMPAQKVKINWRIDDE